MNNLTIRCDKIEDRIKEQQLAEKRGWKIESSGKDDYGYYVHFSKKVKLRKKKR